VTQIQYIPVLRKLTSVYWSVNYNRLKTTHIGHCLAVGKTLFITLKSISYWIIWNICFWALLGSSSL